MRRLHHFYATNLDLWALDCLFTEVHSCRMSFKERWVPSAKAFNTSTQRHVL